MKLKELIKYYDELALSLNKEPDAIKILILELSKFSHSEFYLKQEHIFSDEFVDNLKKKANLYLYDNIPIEYIIGYTNFYGYDFIVNKDVLIPRRETEELVEKTLLLYDEYFTNSKVKVLDLGTGSGAIAITLKKEEPLMDITGVDISDKALIVANKNKELLKVDVKFYKSDWFLNVKDKFDIIISNPPYIRHDEEVCDIVLNEPEIALYGGKNGIIHYENILKKASEYLNDKGLIGFEHGNKQSPLIKDLASKYLNDITIRQKKDLQGHDRLTFIGTGGILK